MNEANPISGQTPVSQGFGSRWVGLLFSTFLADQTDALGELDRRAGDGDFGTNISSAMRRAQANVESTDPSDYRGYLTAVSRGFLGTGGTSGPLFGMFFRDLANCASGREPTAAEFATGLTAGVATVQRYGKAKVGDKTMVDALAPAAEAMTSEVSADATAEESFHRAANAAVQGAQATADILASRGRASYVGEVARGVLDPGAVAAAIMIQAAAAAAAEQLEVDTSWFNAS